jgi:tRNA-specific 2-thiouridylase
MIAVAMSGGVDSSAAAVLLKEQGHSIVGLSMQLWNQRRTLGEEATQDDTTRRVGRCCSIDDLWDARRVAAHIEFPFYVLNLEDEFERAVVAPFVRTYLSGETPSPCVLCNNFVKFHHLMERAEQIGANRVATGHYARVRFDDNLGRWLLLRGRDQRKDQSYFLFGLSQVQLSKTIFPLGEFTKEEVREVARQAGLPTFDKPESQEICFVQQGSYRDFVERYAGNTTTPPGGEIVNLAGEVIGAHSGVHNYTVGQRKGLGAAGRPQYVIRIDSVHNRVVVGDRVDSTCREFPVRDANWIAIDDLVDPIRCHVQIRNRFEAQPGTVSVVDGETRVEFDTPQRAVTPGQAAVFYWNDIVVGGAWISV